MKRQKPLFLVLVAVLLLLALSGCSIIPSLPGGNGSQDPEVPVTATPDIGTPDGVAQTFLDAWERGDYQGMYSHLNSNSRDSYTLEDFTGWYTSTADTMTLESLTTQENSVLRQGDSAQVDFRVTYNTYVLGPVESDLTMLLKFDGERWGVIWSPALIFEGLCNSCDLALDAQTPLRASIYDREGQWLAQEDAAAVTISIVPELINPDSEEQMLERLSIILRQSVDTIRQQYEGAPPNWDIALGDTDAEVLSQYPTLFDDFPALRSQTKSGRRYYNALAPHALGYTGYIPEDQCAEWEQRGYRCDDIVGLLGLENWGEEFLAGKPSGRLSIYTASGEFVTDVATKDAVPSQSIYTTIDRRLQTLVQNALQEAYRAANETWAGGPFPSPGAAVVVLDVNNGDILAMVSYPNFDPNVFVPQNLFPEREARIQGYVDDYRKPFLNRATQGEYPPGSVFKVVSMAAALGEGGYTVESPYTCVGFWDGLGVANRKTDWLPQGHGTISLAQALTFSCDSYFYQVGLDTGNADFNMIPNYARQFGLGAPTGLTQLREAPGLIPDTGWMVQTRGREWTIADSVNVAIGQGDILVTPLQAANMFAAIANGGTLYRPQLVRQIAIIGEEPSWTSQPEVMGTLPLTPENLAVMQNSLWDVQRDPGGTASFILRLSNLPLAGKTGTAQAPGDTALPHAWFVGYAPADDPQIAIAVVLENAGQGADIASPIFRRIAEEYLLGPSETYRYPDFWYDPELYEEFLATVVTE
jgi:penicillin-binding protein 2